MSYEVIVDDVDQAEWEKYAGRFADYSIYQTWPYQETRAEMDGQELSRALVRNESNEVVAMCHVRVKNVRSLGLKIGYVQRGPLVKALDDRIICTTQALAALREAYVGGKVNVLRIVPNMNGDEAGHRVMQMARSSGFQSVNSVAPYRTLVLSLDKSEEEILKSLDRNFRRNLKKAEKSGIEIRQCQGERACEIIRELYLSSVKRKGFKGDNPDEFIKPQMQLSPAEKMSIVVAYHDGMPVTAHLASYLGVTGVALLVASNERGLRFGSSYLAWWKSCIAAKRAGMKIYDLGGINPENDPGCYRFKSQISRQESLGLGAFEACSGAPLGKVLPVKVIWRASEKVYNLVKR